MAGYEKTLIKNQRLREEYYSIDHPSGLKIVVWPMKGYSTTHALFGTKYGSINTTFKTSKESDFVTVPEGIAHYLEHKLFENEDCDVFELYAKTGASANAFTSFDKTCYLFSCTDHYEESLGILLDFVQAPYFTKETVEKEQGIIGQEIRMYDDAPNWRVMFNLLGALYHSHPVKIDIAGTVESIAQIDADLLYRCYHTFYNLHNMVLAVAGNVDVDRILEICDQHLKPCENIGLETVFPEEPAGIVKNVVRQKLEVATPLFQIGFKAVQETGLARVKAEMETNLVLALLADESSALYHELYEEGLINSAFSTEVFDGDGFFCSLFSGESRNPEEVMARILKAVENAKKNGLDRERFDIIKKFFYGSQVREMNNVEAVAMNLIDSAMVGVSAFDAAETVASIQFEDVQNRLEAQFKTECAALSIIEPAAAE